MAGCDDWVASLRRSLRVGRIPEAYRTALVLRPVARGTAGSRSGRRGQQHPEVAVRLLPEALHGEEAAVLPRSTAGEVCPTTAPVYLALFGLDRLPQSGRGRVPPRTLSLRAARPSLSGASRGGGCARPIADGGAHAPFVRAPPPDAVTAAVCGHTGCCPWARRWTWMEPGVGSRAERTRGWRTHSFPTTPPSGAQWTARCARPSLRSGGARCHHGRGSLRPGRNPGASLLHRCSPSSAPRWLCLAARWPVLRLSVLLRIGGCDPWLHMQVRTCDSVDDRLRRRLVPLAVLRLAAHRPTAVLPQWRTLAAAVDGWWWCAVFLHLFGRVEGSAPERPDDPATRLLAFSTAPLLRTSIVTTPPHPALVLGLSRGWMAPLLTLIPTLRFAPRPAADCPGVADRPLLCDTDTSNGNGSGTAAIRNRPPPGGIRTPKCGRRDRGRPDRVTPL